MTTDLAGFALFNPQTDEAFAARMTPVRLDAIRRIEAGGYRLRFLVIESRGPLSREVHVVAHSPSGGCARSRFSESFSPGLLVVQGETSVERPHRRRGLADAMYVTAEVITSRMLYPLWDAGLQQSDGGQALWKWCRREGRVRPFGPREDREA